MCIFSNALKVLWIKFKIKYIKKWWIDIYHLSIMSNIFELHIESEHENTLSHILIIQNIKMSDLSMSDMSMSGNANMNALLLHWVFIIHIFIVMSLSVTISRTFFTVLRFWSLPLLLRYDLSIIVRTSLSSHIRPMCSFHPSFIVITNWIML